MAAGAIKLQGMNMGSVVSAGGNLLSSLVNNGVQLYRDKQARDYNLKLAQMQNEWNIQQWKRENAYNDPSAQLARLKAAGINPDLVYGGGISNTSASSPQMTSGTPYSPSPLVGMPNVVGDYLDAQLKQRQIDMMDKDLERKGIENKYLDAEKALGIKIGEQTYNKNSHEINLLLEELNQSKIRTLTMSTEDYIKRIEAAFRAEELQTQLKLLSNQLKLSDNEVKHMLEAKLLDLNGKKIDNDYKTALLKWEDPKILEQIGGDGAANFFKILMMLLK